MVTAKYKRLAYYTPTHWNPSSPVEIIKGAILLNQVNDKLILQLKLCNNSNENISSVHIQINSYDDTGEAIQECNINFAYQDLDIPPGKPFGEQTPIYLNNQMVRKVNVEIKKVLLASGDTIHVNSQSELEYPSLSPISNFGGELLTELNRITKETYLFDAVTIPQSFNDGVWACLCGKPNVSNQIKCMRCGRDKQWVLEKVNTDYLNQSLLEFKKKLEAERVEKELLLKEHSASRKKKQTRIIWITSIAIVLCAGSYLTYSYAKPKIQYSSAMKKLEQGKYDEAKAIFLELNDFENSKDMVLESDYRHAIDYRKNKKYYESKTLLETIEYRDSKEQLNESIYQYALSLLEKKEYKDAKVQFYLIKQYKDASEQIKKIRLLLKNNK